MGFRNSRVWDIKFIKSILAVVKKMKEFSNKEIIFLINIVFEKQKIVLSIKLEIQNTVDISNLIIIFNNNELLKFLPLIKQEIDDYITQKGNIKY